MRLISGVPNAPTPAGHYSQAVVHDGVVYVAGQVGGDPTGKDPGPGTIEVQTERALRNVETILKAAGSGLDHLLQITLYVTDITLWAQVNAVFTRVLGAHKPARAVVPVKDFKGGMQLEIVCVAAVAPRRSARKTAKPARSRARRKR